MKITPELLQKLFPQTSKKQRDRWIPFWNEILPKYGINNEFRVTAFLGTVGIESDHLRATEEYASGRNYDIKVNPRKAKELGNLTPGDGPKYKGRGGIQRTGKYNYQELNKIYGDKIGVDFVAHPEKLRELEHAVHSDCLFWTRHGLNELADKGKFYAIQGIVNRGQAGLKPLGWEERLEIYQHALTLLPDDFTFDEDFEPDVEEPAKVTEQVPSIESTPAVEPGTTETVKTESILNKFEKVGDTVQTYSEKITNVSNSVAPISKSSAVMTIMTKAAGWMLLVWAFLKDNWLELLIAFGLIALAVWYFSRAKDRQLERSK